MKKRSTSHVTIEGHKSCRHVMKRRMNVRYLCTYTITVLGQRHSRSVFPCTQTEK